MIDHSTQITPWLSLSFWNQAFLHQFLSIVQCIGIVSAKEYLIGEAYKIFKILNKVYCVVFQGKKWGNATLLCPEHVGLQNDRFQSIAPAHPTFLIFLIHVVPRLCHGMTSSMYLTCIASKVIACGNSSFHSCCLYLQLMCNTFGA